PRVAAFQRNGQRRLVLAMSSVVLVGPGVDENSERLGVFAFASLATIGTTPGRGMERIERIQCGPACQEKLDGVNACVVRSPRKHRPKPIRVRRVDVRPQLDELANELELPVVCRVVERGASLDERLTLPVRPRPF